MKVITILILGLAAMLIFNACKPKPLAANDNYRSISVDEAKKMLSEPNVKFLDVRTSEEVAQGYIDGAWKFDVLDSNFTNNMKALDKDRTYVVYCKSGGRSVKASNIMLELGFTDVVNMEGGYTAWNK